MTVRQLFGAQSGFVTDSNGSISGHQRLRQQTFESATVTASVAGPVSSAELPVDLSDDERPVSAIADIDTPTANVSVQSRPATFGTAIFEVAIQAASRDRPRRTEHLILDFRRDPLAPLSPRHIA